SIFIISVNTDIHFYGLLKTIGTTGKQIRKIIKIQALALSAAGIPIGLLLGYATGVYLSPLILNILSVGGGIQTSANPLIFAFAAAFSMLTVFIGCRKPGQIAARVSPVDAVKYSGAPSTVKRQSKKTRKVTMLSMAWANVTREKRKLSMIVISLSLSLILLNSAFSAIKSFDMDKYMSKSIISDFTIAHTSIFGPEIEKNTNGVTDELLRGVGQLGESEISNIYYHELFDYRSEEDFTIYEVYGVDRVALEYFSDIDYEKLRSGSYAIVSKDSVIYGDGALDIPEVGGRLTLKSDSPAGSPRGFEVLGLTDEYPHLLSKRAFYGNSLTVIIAEDVFLDFFGASQPMQTNINVNAEDIGRFEAWLENYTANQNPELKFISRNTLKAEFDGLRATYITLGGAMSAILALIGIMNFVNAVVASIITRRRELAMLQGVGMTGRQIRNILLFEGLCYTTLTAFFTLTVGFALSLLIVKVMAGSIWFFNQHLTVMPSVLSLAPLLIICAAIPLICHKKLNKGSLVERLRVE
ncbi:MAG: FtsX-like permease family protein, partial [Clostridiales bacterium]|nr:FtsX-like permease family protein [Clostridiales bacterium]